MALADLLAERGDVDGAVQVLRPPANAIRMAAREALAAHAFAATRLALLLADSGDLDGLRARANAGDGPAAEQLAERGDLDGAVQVLRAPADAGSIYAATRLADLLVSRGVSSLTV